MLLRDAFGVVRRHALGPPFRDQSCRWVAVDDAAVLKRGCTVEERKRVRLARGRFRRKSD
ncbi:hypothetical protein C8039_19090 [Halogeometricum sp. wsp3]|nr:hypothetical protein C8039_19090 [Halogeometricum sp. wsp3]